MTFRVVPGTGLVLPADAGVLRFGMTEREARWTAATLADVREGGWTCGARWIFHFFHRDVLVTAHSCTGCAGRTLGHLAVERTDRVPQHAAGVPVAFGDYDLFGYPVHELTDVLAPQDRALLLPADLNPHSTHYLSAVRLDACEGDRR